MADEWTKEWPKEQGWHWAYLPDGGEHVLLPVHVRTFCKDGKSGIFYQLRGTLLVWPAQYKGQECWFTKAGVPEPPDIG